MDWSKWLLGVDRALVDQFQRWEIRWQAMPKAWVLVLLVAPLVIGIPWFFYRKENKTAGAGARFFLSILRSALIAILLLALFQPILYLERELTKESYIIVLIDESKSMTLADKYTEEAQYDALAKVTGLLVDGRVPPEAREKLLEARRIELVNMALKNPELRILEQFKERYIFKPYGFAKGISPDPALGSMEATGDVTAIGDAIESVLKELHGQPIAAMVIISDGRSNSGEDPADVAARLEDRGLRIPIYTVGVGNPLDPKDIALSKLEAPDVAVAGDYVQFKFAATSQGFDGQTVQVFMKNEGLEVTVPQDVVLVGKGQEQQVEMKWKPERPGDYEILISTPVRSEELVEANNELVHKIRIVDNKIKILYIEGYPRWEYRYLKNALVRDKTMEVQVYLMSADQGFPQEGTPGLPILTELPGTRKELAKYDVIILGDVDPNSLFTSEVTAPQMQENLVNFVEELGGGIVMIAGEHWAPRMYSDTPLARILPITVDRTSNDNAIIHDEPVRAELTPLGKVSPLINLAPTLTPEENLELWMDADGRGDGLAGFYWFFRSRSPKAGAQVLAAHPSFEVENGQKLPIFLIQRTGRGMTFFSAVDSTWRWRYIRGDQYFYTFWGQIVRHLRSGKLIGSRRFLIELDKNRYVLGDPVRIRARVLDREYAPISEPSYPVQVTAKNTVATDEIEMKAIDNPTADPSKAGWFEVIYKPGRKGEYEVSVGPRGLDDADPRSVTGFIVEDPSREFDDNPTMDVRTLKGISDVTRGKFLTIYEIDRLLSTIKETGEIVDIETKEQDLWDTPLVFLLFTLLVTIEWVVRKIVRLI